MSYMYLIQLIFNNMLNSSESIEISCIFYSYSRKISQFGEINCSLYIY
ncbi:hypothetical protein J2736_005835 [Paenibacillus qinlingensis]|uniref:Uncharacterized protein n=1 Tax=Paenibacillus qinlingensis TaxID=1837343 RepID=A0ABU1P4C0_9BACL|nr:hypothetical protein [Paenibacillus qinlingensis]